MRTNDHAIPLAWEELPAHFGGRAEPRPLITRHYPNYLGPTTEQLCGTGTVEFHDFGDTDAERAFEWILANRLALEGQLRVAPDPQKPFRDLLFITGLPADSNDVSAPDCIDLAELRDQLIPMGRGLDLCLALQRANVGRARAVITDSYTGLGRGPDESDVSMVLAELGDDRGLRFLVQWWMRARLADLKIPLTTASLNVGEAFSLVPAPVSALQLLWLIMAVTVGLKAPAPKTGVYQCDYQNCGRLFLTAKTVVKGNLRFCSSRCGKSHHAITVMKAKRFKEAEVGG